MFHLQRLRQYSTPLPLAAVLACLLPTHPYAQTSMDAQTLFEICVTPEADWIAFCAGFIQAANDQAAHSGLSCAPTGTTRADLIDTFVGFAGEAFTSDPDLGAATGLSVAITSVADAYPCN